MTDGVSGPRYWLYLLPFVLVPVLLVGVGFVVIPSRWFVTHSGDLYMANEGYGDRLVGRECKVLVYGDSTAMVGVDPAIIQAKTGLSTCNIAEYAGVTLVSGTLPVDRFLAKNPRPEFVVFVYAPENLARSDDWGRVSTFEAIGSRVAKERNAGTAWTLATHPTSTLTWVEVGMRMALLRMRSTPMDRAEEHLRDGNAGQWKIEAPEMTECRDIFQPAPPDPRWLEGLKKTYGVGGTRVIVDATPLMACDDGLAYYQAHVRGLVDDDPVPVYPVGDFLDEHGARMHMNAKGSAKLSAMIAEQVNARKGGQ